MYDYSKSGAVSFADLNAEAAAAKAQKRSSKSAAQAAGQKPASSALTGCS